MAHFWPGQNTAITHAPPGFGNGNSEIITALTLRLPIRTTMPFRLPTDVTALRRLPRESLWCRFISPTRCLL
jgi:hypothetical protein